MSSYQVLARKWRPQTFDDVAGQESVVRTLQRALETGRVAHAFLFTGSRGIGKTTIARVLARALSCETGITPSPCGQCSMCREITEGKSVDVIEIDGASNTGVDDVRELREVARFLPQKGRFKVFIIDEVHMLSTGAFNALLKTLEEPPEHVKFIFATTEAHKIPVTILSRCQRYDFKRIPTKVIVERLRHVLAEEKVAIDEAGLSIIARAAEGGMRDALSLTDQVISFAGTNVGADQVTEALGLIDRRSIVRATWAVVERDARAALEIIEEAFARGHDLKQLAESVTAELRHLTVAKAVGSIAGFADLAPEDAAEIDEKAKGLESRDLQRLFFMSLEGADLITKSDNPRLALELIFLRMCDRPALGEAAAISDAISRLDALARGRPVPPPRESAGPAVEIAREALRASSSTERSSSLSPPASAAPAPAPAPAPASPPTSEKAAPPSPPAVPPPPPAAKPEPEPPPSPPRASAPVHAAGGEVEAATLERPAPAAAPTKPAPEPPPSEERDDDVPPWMDEAPPFDERMTAAPARPSAPPPEVEEEDDEEPEEVFDPALGYLLEGVDDRWLAVVRQVARESSSHLAGHLTQARFVAADKKGGHLVVKVAFDRRPNLDAVSDAVARGELTAALAASFGEGAVLEAMLREGDGPSAPNIAEAQRAAAAKAQADLEAHAKAHPVVKKALELFGGEVRQVRRDA